MKHQRNVLSTGLLALVFAVSLAAAPAGATSWEIDNNHSEVAFQIRHFVTQVRGHFDTFGGTVVMDDENMANSSVEFWVETESIDTRNDNRDKHLRSADFFEVEKYPRITFTSEKIVKTGDNSFDVTGTFTMHGVSKTITLPVTFLGTMTTQRGAKAGFATETELDRKEYGIVWNQALDAGGAMLSDNVSVEINLELNEKAPAPAAGQ
jgi:polyisoprenoid-binding protein YceI